MGEGCIASSVSKYLQHEEWAEMADAAWKRAEAKGKLESADSFGRICPSTKRTKK